MSKNGARLAQAKAELAEQSLALAHAELDPIPLLDERRQHLAVPEDTGEADGRRRTAQYPVDLGQGLVVQRRRAARPFSFEQSSQAVPRKAVDPILHAARRITEQSGYVRAGHPLGHQQHAVQAVVVARLVRAANLVLQPEDDGRIVNRQRFHAASMTPADSMRNYLCRYV